MGQRRTLQQSPGKGMKVAQKHNNEDHLVSYIREIPAGDRYYHGSTVTDWVVYYDQSPVYAPLAPREDAEPEPAAATILRHWRTVSNCSLRRHELPIRLLNFCAVSQSWE